MFNNISSNYDFLNRILSGRVDVYWRSRVLKELKKDKPSTILDIATGTGDLAITLSKINSVKITGIDISEKMIEIGVEKKTKKNLQHIIHLKVDDSENLSFNDHVFDAVTVSFGVRNFMDLKKGIQEIFRVLKPGGVFYVLEFSIPKSMIVRSIYIAYSKYMMPFIGKLISKDPKAYEYLFESVQHFPYGEKFADILSENGFQHVTYTPLTFGIATLYKGYKK